MSLICRYTAVAPQNPCQEQNLLFVNSYGDKPRSASVTQEHRSTCPSLKHPIIPFLVTDLNASMPICFSAMQNNLFIK